MAARLLMMIMFLLVVPGCKLVQDPESLPFVDDRYEFQEVENQEKRLVNTDYDMIQEIRIADGSIVDLAEFFRKKTSKTLVSNAVDLKLNGLFTGTPREIAQQVALANNLTFAQMADVFYLVSSDARSPLNVSCSFICDLSIEDLRELFPDVLFLRRDNQVIVSGNFFAVKAVQDYLDVVNAVDEQNYVITVVEVETSLDFALQLQLEISSKGVDLIRPGLSAYDFFAAVARANGQSITSDNYHERQLVVTSGQLTSYSRSVEKKLEQRAISDQGTSTVSGYENVSAGVIMEMTVNSYNADRVELSYNVELSNFVGASLDKTSVKANSDRVLIKPGKVYYIASSEDRRREKSALLLGLGRSNDVVVSSIYVKIDKICK